MPWRKRASPLERALTRNVRGEVRFDDGSRALYATDSSNYRQVPIGVVIPQDIEALATAVEICREHDAPVLPRGAGTSLAGQCCNEAVVIDCSKYLNRVLEIDAARRLARVEPGCVLDDLRRAAERHGLTFGPDPSTHDRNTLGGMLGNDSCGVHSIMAGRTSDNTASLDLLTYDGLRLPVGATPDAELERIIAAGGRRSAIYGALRDLRDRYAPLIRARYPKIPRRISGYSLDALLPEHGFNVARALVGSEGTCVIICEAELQLIPSPPARVLVVLGYQDIFQAADAVPWVLEHQPIGLEAFDEVLTSNLQAKHRYEQELALLPSGGGWLLAEFGADTADAAAASAHRLVEALQRRGQAPRCAVHREPAEQKMIWRIREVGLGATAHVPGQADTWEGWEDAAVPPEQLGAYLRAFRQLLDTYGYIGALYGHFGDGCVHTRIDFDLLSEPGIAKYREFVSRAAELVVRHGGSLSGEHGDGQARGELLAIMYGEELVQAFREFKAIWDPRGRMNPGKVVDAAPITAHLRFGARYSRPSVKTAFSYASDGGSFARATERCVGIGVCRRMHEGVMCPSYMVTGEERHSTRGRARLLFEMLRGDALPAGWRSTAVHEALDLCLACKGCKRDCPVEVDMATYKAEFNARYYRHRLRPRAAYSMGLIWWWCRAAARMPGIVNGLTQTPLLREAVKLAGGIHLKRQMPRFAAETFRRRFARRQLRTAAGDRVVLFPDTFTEHFYPEIASAAVDVLERAGCSVLVPDRALCCARPLYAWGMLDAARKLLTRLLETLESEEYAGCPVVFLEPSCCAAMRDELPNLFARDERARRLARRSVTLGEFLNAREDYQPPRAAARALVQVHCNQHAVMTYGSEAALLGRMGVDFQVLDSGCCGMAGSFGFESDHYELAMQIGERVLLPAVRSAAADTLILADGFSCREQILQATGRRALHLAELLRRSQEQAIDQGVSR